MRARIWPAAVLLFVLVAVPGWAQPPSPPPNGGPGAPRGPASAEGPAPQPPDIAPAEIQRLFDAYVVMQAQERLGLNDVQFAQFVSRLRTLQATRRRSDQARHQAVQELAALLSSGADDARLKDRLKALQELDARNQADLRRSYDALDQILSARQQAQFRVFEQQMERRKLELISRARGAAPRGGRMNRPLRP